MIKTIIFDIGGVLVGYDWDAYLMKTNDNDRVKVDLLKDALFKRGLWAETDRGVWSEEKLLSEFVKVHPDVEKEIHAFWNTAGGALWQYEWTKDWLTDLKTRGYRLLFLSNWSAHMYEQAGDKLDFLSMMDGGIFSYRVNLIKPDAAIYEAIIEKYELNPSECIFLDDREENCKAAIECGLKAQQVIKNESAVKLLEERLAELE